MLLEWGIVFGYCKMILKKNMFWKYGMEERKIKLFYIYIFEYIGICLNLLDSMYKIV